MRDSLRVRPFTVRLLALACAVGLAGLLVGLSVAPSELPGDTFNVTPKAAAGAAVDLSQASDHGLNPGGHALPAPSPDLVAVAGGVLAVVVLLFARTGDTRPVRAGQRPAAVRGRAPPLAG